MNESGRGQVEAVLVERELAAARRAGAGFGPVAPNPKVKLMDQVREVQRLRHYSIRTEEAYCDWIRRYEMFLQTAGLPLKLAPGLSCHSSAGKIAAAPQIGGVGRRGVNLNESRRDFLRADPADGREQLYLKYSSAQNP